MAVQMQVRYDVWCFRYMTPDKGNPFSRRSLVLQPSDGSEGIYFFRSEDRTIRGEYDIKDLLDCEQFDEIPVFELLAELQNCPAMLAEAQELLDKHWCVRVDNGATLGTMTP